MMVPINKSGLAVVVLIAAQGLTSAARAQVTSSSPTLAVLGVNVSSNNLVWDPKSQKIYLTLPSAAGAAGNSVQVLDPVTGTLGANAFAGSEPDRVAVSASGQYLYVGLDGASSIQRFTLPNLGTDIAISLGSSGGPLFATDLEASPNADGTVAAILSSNPVTTEMGGTAVIYDGGSARPGTVCSYGQSGCPDYGLNELQWNANGSVVYGAGEGLYSIPVAATGFGAPSAYSALGFSVGAPIHFDAVTGDIYSNSGEIADPRSGMLVGKFGASGLMVPDGNLGTAFFLEPQQLNSVSYVVQSFDIHRLTPIATIILSNVQGTPTHFIRWGTNGLAFTTSGGTESAGGQVYVLSGSFVGPPPAAGTAPTISFGGIVPIGSTSSLIAPGEWVAIYGTNLAPGVSAWTGNFPASLAGTSVTVGGEQAYLSYASPGQINIQVPQTENGALVPVVVTTPAGSVNATVGVGGFSPSFPLLDTTHVAAIILRSDGSGAYGDGTYDILGPTGTSLGYPTVAARAGDSVALFALGLGPTIPFVAPGQGFEGAAPCESQVTLRIDKVNVVPGFVGLSSAGLYQINFTVPAGLGTGDVPIALSLLGSQTPLTDVISLQ